MKSATIMIVCVAALLTLSGLLSFGVSFVDGPWASDPNANGDFPTRKAKISFKTTYPLRPRMDLLVVLPDGRASKAITDGSTTAPTHVKRPVVMVVHGFGGWALQGVGEPVHAKLAEHLASRGFVVALFGHPNTFELSLDAWRKNVIHSIDALKSANEESGNPIEGELDFERFALLGHSYGGATIMSVAAMQGLPVKVSAAVAYAPGVCKPGFTLLIGDQQKKFLEYSRSVKCPLAVISDEFDLVVPHTDFALPAYQLAPARPKLYVEIARGEHFNFAELKLPLVWWGKDLSSEQRVKTLPAEDQRWYAERYATAWLEMQLGIRSGAAAEALRKFTDGSEAQADVARGVLTRYFFN